MRPAARTHSGRRSYAEADFRRLRFIRRSRELGFDTNAIRSLLILADTPQSDCGNANEIAKGHLHEVELKLVQLNRLKHELKKITEICVGGAASECGVLEALGAH